jgi:hypothetical protein
MVSSAIHSRMDACHTSRPNAMLWELSYGTAFIDLLLPVGTIHCLGKADHDEYPSMIYSSNKEAI